VKRFLLAAAAALAAATAHAGSVSLEEVTAEALAKNPAVTAYDARRQMAEAGLREARSMALPRVDASQTILRSDNPVFVFGSLLEQGRFAARHFDPAFLNDPDPLTNFRFGLNLRYAVFDQLRRRDAEAQARNAVEQAGLGGEEARQRIRSEAIARFYGLLLAEKKRDVAAEAVRSAEADAAAMRDRYEQGLLVESELLAAEVQLASFRQQLIEAEGDVAIARAALATLMQRPATEPLSAGGAIPETIFDESPLDGALAAALAQRASIAIARAESENAKIRIAGARNTRLPRVDAFASLGASAGSLDEIGSDSALGVVVSLDLFDAGRAARIASARAALEGAQSAEQMARDAVTMEVVTAWNRVRAARERIGVAAKSAERAAAASRIVRDRYENGLTTITEHLRAQTALVMARLELLAARYDHVTGHAELLRATGGLKHVEAFQ
jgi:outer membrane protein TolC